MKSLLTPCADASPVLSWDDTHLIVGTVVNMNSNVFSISAMTFHPYGGFQVAEPDMTYDVEVDDLHARAISMKPGCQTICMGKGTLDAAQKKLRLDQDALILHRPEFSADFGWDAVHLFCGAFGGWSQAIKWMSRTKLGIVVGREIFIDYDRDVMECWAQKYGAKYGTLPLGKIKIWDAALKVGLLGPIDDRSWMHTLFTQVNLIQTASPPCVSWSRGGKKRGIQCTEGWAFVDSILNGFFTQACILTFECADEFRLHPESKLVCELLLFFGYKKIWEQVVTLHNLSDCFRTRWISAWSRCDVPAVPIETVFMPKASTKHSWTSDIYRFDLPDSMVEQLRLSPSELAVYSNPEFLPANKRTKKPQTKENTLELRTADARSPLPTLCASYSVQHCLQSTHLADRGIFAVLLKDEKHVSFVDPPRWISLLGATEKIILPSKVSVAFKIVGNAIAVPHALLGLLFAFQSTHNTPLDITDTIRLCWNNRLTAPTSVILAGMDFWTLLPMQEYMNSIKACVMDFPPQGTQINILLTFRRHTQKAEMRIPAQWSFKRFILHVLGIDHHASRTITCGNNTRRGDAHYTLQHMAALDQEWDISLKSIEFAKLIFKGLSIPERHQSDHGCLKRLPNMKQPIRLEIPTFEQTLETPTFQSFLSIMEGFYATTTVVTADDAKQNINLGIPHPGFVTKIPIRRGGQLEQLRQIATTLFPHEPTRVPHIAPVPLSATRQYPLYMLAKANDNKQTISVFVEEHRTPSNIYTAELPENIQADDQLQFHGKVFDILYYNAARLNDASHIRLHPADILTVTQTQPNKKQKHTDIIVAAGHHNDGPAPHLKAPIRFLDRVEFAINTRGWMASDEMHFGCEQLEQFQPGFGKYIGVGVWTEDTADILPLHDEEFSFRSESNNYMPLLVGAHWGGVCIRLINNQAAIQTRGIHHNIAPAVQIAIARLLDMHPQRTTLQCDRCPPIPHMCGWTLLHHWYQMAGAHPNRPNPFPTWHSLTGTTYHLIDELMAESDKEWTRTRAPPSIIDFARWLRLLYFSKIATGISETDIVLRSDLVSTGPQTMQTPPQNPPITEEQLALSHRLNTSEEHPLWMMSDELDFALDFLRAARPDTYFAPPQEWHSDTQTLYAFNNYHIDTRAYTHAYFFILQDHHWHLIETNRVSRQILLFSTFTDDQPTLYHAICQTADVTPERVQVSHIPHHTPDGLCGWNLLAQLMMRRNVAFPSQSSEHLRLIDLSSQVEQFNRIRAKMRRHLDRIEGHQDSKELAFTIRTWHITRIAEGRWPRQYNKGGAQDSADKAKDKDKENKANKAKKAIVDPLFINDPWAKKQNKIQQTKWEDLHLPQTHPFQDNKGTPLPQLHRLQHAANRQGIILSTKQHLADLTKTQTDGPLAILLPGADKSSYGDAAQHLTGPYEVVLEDKGIQSSYKRLVLMWVVIGDVKYNLPAPATKCNAADYVELVAELDSRLVPAQEFHQAKSDPMATMKKLLTAIHRDLRENITMYGLRRNSTGPSSQDSHIQVICRAKLLEASGAHALLMRDFIDQPTQVLDTTVLPKFFPTTAASLHDLHISKQGVPGAAGITLARRGLALRVWTSSIAEARQFFMADDSRITKENMHVIPRHTVESSGWPTSIEASSIISTVLEATGCAPIPTRAYRTAGVHSWTLAFQDKPTKDRFTVEVGGSLHEILLVASQQRYNPKAVQSQQNGRTKKARQAAQEPAHQLPAALPLGIPSSKPDTTRIDKLEARVGELETRQTNFEAKFDSRLDGVDSALRQLLQRTEAPRQRETSGDTPPPKHPKL